MDRLCKSEVVEKGIEDPGLVYSEQGRTLEEKTGGRRG